MKVPFCSQETLSFLMGVSLGTFSLCSAGVESPALSKVQKNSSRVEAFVHSFAASSASTVISSAMTYPLDVMTVYRQAGILEKKNLYKGFGPHCAAVTTQVGLRLTLWDELKKLGLSSAESGSVSHVIASSIANPLWIYQVKKTLAPNETPYSPSTYFKDIKNHPSTLFRGQMVNLAKGAPMAGYFHAYEGIKSKLNRSDSGQSNTSEAREFATNVAAGGTARLAVQAVGHPMDTVNVIKQQTGLSYYKIFSDLSKEGAKSFSEGKFLEAARATAAKFYRGFALSSTRATLGTAISMGVYNEIKIRTSDTK